MIVIPDEFIILCRNHFHQDAMLICKMPEALVASAVESLSEERRRVLRGFLDELFRAPNPVTESKRAWRKSPAEIHFRKGDDLLAFLRMMRHALGSDD